MLLDFFNDILDMTKNAQVTKAKFDKYDYVKFKKLSRESNNQQ